MNRDAGLCRQICAFSRAHQRRRFQRLVDERAQHRQQQRHQERRRTALAGDVAERDDDAAVGQRQHVVEIATDRVGRPRHAADLDVADGVGAARQHRELDLARDFQLALERQPVGHLEQHEQVDQEQADDERERAVGPDRQQQRDLDERHAERHVDGREAAKQPDDADQRDEQRADVEHASRRRQPQREGDEDLPDAQRHALPPRQAARTGPRRGRARRSGTRRACRA